MRILGIDHVAICAPGVEEAARPFVELLAMSLGPAELVASQRTHVRFVLPGDDSDGEGACVEMIAPAEGNAGLARFLAKRGQALHHVAFRVDDLAAALRELDGRGVPLIDRAPRPGARGHLVGFLHPSAFGGVLVELVEHGAPSNPPSGGE